jgi:hypothetical protein
MESFSASPIFGVLMGKERKDGADQEPRRLFSTFCVKNATSSAFWLTKL